MTITRPPLASGALDRDAPTRMDPERLAQAWHEPGARVLRLRGALVPIASARDALSLVETASVAPEYALAGPDGAAHTLYLGRMGGSPVFGVADTGEHEAPGEAWTHPFELGDRLTDTERELIAITSSLLRWHESSRYSPRDGSLMRPEQGGWARVDAHGGEHFPRTDPAVIVLIEHADRILLGSNALWETGRFSLLAGFVEGGEALEQTVEREVFEEAGVRVDDITYIGSQPWPFPRSLMLGFYATLADGQDPDALHPDPSEISELRWFTREELREAGPFTFPMSMSIARWLIDLWVDGRIGAGEGRGR